MGHFFGTPCLYVKQTNNEVGAVLLEGFAAIQFVIK